MRSTMVLRNERGVTLALMAVTVFLTLGMAAIAIDYGMIKTAKAEAQRAMDASALAGASALLISDPAVNIDSAAKSRAKEYASKHVVRGVPIDTVTEVPSANVHVDLVDNKVKVDWSRAGIGLWFARMFGANSMGLTATATAHVEQTSTATCVKPVAIPDIWDNRPHIVGGTDIEDKNGDHVWDYVDGTGRGSGTVGQWDEGEGEPWTYDPSLGDNYSAASGYGTTFRDSYGSGTAVKSKDYGRQIMLTTFSPKDSDVESMYYSWGQNTDYTNADSVAAAIRGNRCQEAALGTNYAAANGGKIGPIQAAWGDLIAQDPSATWVDAVGGGTVTGSTYGADWQNSSPRVIIVALYNPSIYATGPSANTLQFLNLAKVWVDQRPCAGPPGSCKAPITARFLGFVTGGGATGAPVGTLVRHLVLIK
jgi:hypothetical protein